MRNRASLTVWVATLVLAGIATALCACLALVDIGRRAAGNQPLQPIPPSTFSLLVRAIPGGGYTFAPSLVQRLTPNDLLGWDGVLSLQLDYERSYDTLPFFGVVRGPRPALVWGIRLVVDRTGFRPRTEAAWRTLLEVARDAIAQHGNVFLGELEVELGRIFASPGVLRRTPYLDFPELVGRVHLSGPTWDDDRLTIRTIQWIAVFCAVIIVVTLGTTLRQRWLHRRRRRRGLCEGCGQSLCLGTARLLVCSECGADGRPAAAKPATINRDS